MTRITTLFAFVLAFVAAGNAQNAAVGSAMAKTPILEVGANFLMFTSVHKELGLSTSVSQKMMQNYQNAMRKMMSTPPSKSKDPNVMRKDMQARVAEMRKLQLSSLAMLTAPQKARLKQITIQQMGASSLLHPEVKNVLKLNADQERKIGAIVRDGTMQMMSGIKSSSNSEEMKKAIADMQKRREQWQIKMKSMASKQLTAGQRSQWAAMQGKPFKLDVMQGMRSMMPSVRGKGG